MDCFFYIVDQPGPVQDNRPLCYGPCVICGINKIRVLFIDCRHLVCCFRCANQSSTCPKCGQAVSGRLSVFEPSWNCLLIYKSFILIDNKLDIQLYSTVHSEKWWCYVSTISLHLIRIVSMRYLIDQQCGETMT